MVRILTMALAVAAFLAAPGRAQTYEALVVFGDSLSDTGNAGRFTNGPVWVEGLAGRLGLSVTPSAAGGSNYAVGGARLDPATGATSIPAQVRRYVATGARPEGSLFVVYGGGNDLIAAALSAEGEAAVAAALDGLATALVALADHGAAEMLVPNLPDIGIVPAASGAGPGALERARRLSERFNGELARLLAALEAERGVRVHRLDVQAMAERARRDPAAFGFADVRTPCIGRASCAGHLFWDGVHPTAEAHARLADAAARALDM